MQLKERFRSGLTVHRLNLVNAGDPEIKQRATDRFLNNGEARVSDWNTGERLKTPLIDPSTDGPSEVTRDIIHEDYLDDITGEIKWDRFRDALHEEKYSEQDTRIKAGNAKGVIRRFLFDADIGDLACVNTARGTVFAVFTGPAEYAPDSAPSYDRAQVFRRDVDIVRDEDGNPITIEAKHLPTPLKPNQLTMTSLDREDLQTLLGQQQAFDSLEKAATAASDFK